MRSFSSQKEAVIFECAKKKLQVTDYRGFGVNTKHSTKITVPSYEGFFIGPRRQFACVRCVI